MKPKEVEVKKEEAKVVELTQEEAKNFENEQAVVAEVKVRDQEQVEAIKFREKSENAKKQKSLWNSWQIEELKLKLAMSYYFLNKPSS